MYEQEVKMHVKEIKMQAKIKQNKKNRQTIKAESNQIRWSPMESPSYHGVTLRLVRFNVPPRKWCWERKEFCV